MKDEIVLYRARGIWCPDRNYRDNGAVAVREDGRIILAGPWDDVRREAEAAPVRDCGEAILIPGFVNAHSHLEYSFLRGAMPRGAGCFLNWLTSMVMAKLLTPRDTVEAAIAGGLEEMTTGGARAIGEICSTNAAVAPLESGVMAGGRLYVEAISPSHRERDARWQNFNETWNAVTERRGRFAIGISPHAPYSVAAGIWNDIQAFRNRHGDDGRPLWQCIHCSETMEEVEMMTAGRGALAAMLRERGILDEDWRAPGCTPTAWLDRVSALDERTLLVHCNYLEPGDIEIIRRRGCSVAVCPGTHQWFGHTKHPLKQLTEAGVNVCLGTDSLASNEGLAMLREMALVRAVGPECDFPLSALLRMATVNGARALGLNDGWGTLQSGAPGGVLALTAARGWKTLDDLAVNEIKIMNRDR